MRDSLGAGEQLTIERLVKAVRQFPAIVQEDLCRNVDRAHGILLPITAAIRAAHFDDTNEFLGQRRRDLNSLVDALCEGDGPLVELRMPTGAVFGRSLILAKVNFFKALRYCLTRDDVHMDPDPGLLSALEDLVDDAILSLLAEELLTGAATNPRNSSALRRAAGVRLVNFWLNCIQHPVVQFPALLLEAWRARRRMREIYGSLVGIHEIMELVRRDEPGGPVSLFVSFFQSDEVSHDQAMAFREFLFSLPYEDLVFLERYMNDTDTASITRERVCELLGRPLPDPQQGAPTAEEVYASYRRRRVRSEYRSLHNLAGPKKTAEGYIMEFLLREGADGSFWIRPKDGIVAGGQATPAKAEASPIEPVIPTSLQLDRGPENDIRISGRPAELRAVAHAVREVGTGRRPEAQVSLVAADARPALLSVLGAANPVRVRSEDNGTNRVVLRGGNQLLHIAAWLEALAARPGRSVRLAWFQGHPYIAEFSPPVVLACTEGDAAS
ncbi:MAG TPA: hypothetical protein VKY73_01690 [Polyangiaceae bacterium]|nr:hypothetical protein [Polyangiaceae bacterium]